MNEKRNSFSSSLGFVLAAAGSAVGLGNIWRFPYLAAKDGGGLFLFVYIILALTFGFTMLVTEVAIGRKTKQSALTAYGKLHKKSGWIGVFASVVPFMILPYYCIIGGWVLKYCVAFVTGQASATAGDGYFTGFITGYFEPIIFDVIFLAAGKVLRHLVEIDRHAVHCLGLKQRDVEDDLVPVFGIGVLKSVLSKEALTCHFATCVANGFFQLSFVSHNDTWNVLFKMLVLVLTTRDANTSKE